MISNRPPCPVRPDCTTSPLLLDRPETPHEPLRRAKSPGDAGQPSQHWPQNLQNRTWPDAPGTTHSAGLCPLSIIATYKNSNPCYWKIHTQERESEVVTQSVTPCWLNLAALVCFCLKYPRVSWFSIMTFYMNKWITWEKKLSNAPPRLFDFQPAKRPTTEGQTCIFPLEVSLPTITSSLFFHSQSSHGYGSPLTHKWGAGNTTSENLYGPLANPTFPSAVPEELPAVCHCAKCKYSNDSFQKIPNNKQPNQKKKKKRWNRETKLNWSIAEVCTAGSPRTKQMNETVEMPPATPVVGCSISGSPLRASKCLYTPVPGESDFPLGLVLG